MGIVRSNAMRPLYSVRKSAWLVRFVRWAVQSHRNEESKSATRSNNRRHSDSKELQTRKTDIGHLPDAENETDGLTFRMDCEPCRHTNDVVKDSGRFDRIY